MFNPISIGIMGGSALLGGLTDLFGGDDSQERLDEYIKYMTESKNKIMSDTMKNKIAMFKMNEAGKKNRVAAANQKASQSGFDPVTGRYSAEEDLDNNLYSTLNSLDNQQSQLLKSIDDNIAAAKLGAPQEESGIERFMGGFLGGANIGSGIAGIVNKAGMPGGGDEAAQLPDNNNKPLPQNNNPGNMVTPGKEVLPETTGNLSSGGEKAGLMAGMGNQYAKGLGIDISADDYYKDLLPGFEDEKNKYTNAAAKLKLLMRY